MIALDHLLQLLLALAIMIGASKIAGGLSKRIGQPAVLGELAVGLILGPTVLDMMHWPIFAAHGAGAAAGHSPLLQTIKDLAELGVILLMFLAGLETDLNQMQRVGLAATLGAVGGVAVPFGLGVAVSFAAGYGLYESVFIGTILTATSVAISAQTLLELGQLRSKEGSTIMGAAVIDDILGIIVLSLVVALHGASGADAAAGAAGAAGGTWAQVAWILVKMAGYFAGAILLGTAVIPRIARWAENFPGTSVVTAIAVVVGLVLAWAAQYLGGVAAITGSYLAGLLFARTRVRHTLEHELQSVSYSFFVPVFFVSIGLEANARDLNGALGFAALITLMAIVGKIAGSGLFVRVAGFTWLQSLRVGIGMVSRGEVALIVSAVGLTSGVIDQGIFSIMVLMTLVTTLITPVLLRMVFPRMQPAEGESFGA